MPDRAWELLVWDLFDRNAAPLVDMSGTGTLDGLDALWRKTLFEGLNSRGRRTLTGFSLRFLSGENKIVQISLSPTGTNDGVLKLRQWVEGSACTLTQIAEHHASWLRDDPAKGTRRFLAAALEANKPEDLACGW